MVSGWQADRVHQHPVWQQRHLHQECRWDRHHAPNDQPGGRRIAGLEPVGGCRRAQELGSLTQFLEPESYSGLMFWFIRNRFVGSYVRLIATSRSYFSGP